MRRKQVTSAAQFKHHMHASYAVQTAAMIKAKAIFAAVEAMYNVRRFNLS
jgi:hypothetical protein